MNQSSRAWNWIIPAISGALIIGLWYAVRLGFGLQEFVLPTPDEIIRAGWQERETLISAAFITSRGAVLGFLAAVSVGFLLAMVMGFSLRLKAAFYPYILVLQMMPIAVLAPIYRLWLGEGLRSIVAITFMIGFFPVVANTTMGFVSVDRNLRDLFLMCKATRAQEIRYLRIPGAMPYFLTGMKIAGTLAPIGAIVGDYLAGTSQDGMGGIGYQTILFAAQVRTAELFATGLTACMLGFIFVGGINWLHWALLHSWHDSMIRKE